MYDPDARMTELIATWAKMPKGVPLQEFLGMTDKEYKSWVYDPDRFWKSGLGCQYAKDILGL